MKNLQRIVDRLKRHDDALGFVADHVPDHQGSITIWTIQDDLKKTIKQIKKLQRQ